MELAGGMQATQPGLCRNLETAFTLKTALLFLTSYW